jgi:predicted transcriptional regulator
VTVPGEQITEAVQELLDANRGTRSALEASEGVLVQGLELLGSGRDLVTILRSIPVGAYRQTTQVNSDRMAAARHRLRVLVIAACVDAGLTPREIADEWGMSRQRVDQFLQEYRKTQDG